MVARLRKKLEPHGYTVESFSSSSLSSFAEAGECIPPELEASLLASLQSPLFSGDEVDWDKKGVGEGPRSDRRYDSVIRVSRSVKHDNLHDRPGRMV